MSDFASMIRKMENEVTALKTAHERGLGAVDFYSKTASASGDFGDWGYIEITIVATVASGELTPAFCQPQITVTNVKTLTLDSFSQSGNTLTWKYSANGDENVATSVNVKIISASKLSTLGVSLS